ncbi:MAG TPA: glycoside hydrolase family 2 protein [Chloroflexota bacterium]|nr:glycoside hydrolase family 2 protein [Chloroflexota bacterium]
MFERAKLQDFAPGEGAQAGAQHAVFDDSTWIDVPVPGDVHRALIAAGRIADPYYDRNEESCAWMEEREWWYRLRFDGPGEPLRDDERLRLVFHSLDTYATIWLNGVELGRHANMFTPAVFDVTGRVRPGANTLALLFDRPLDHTQALAEVEPWGRNPERIPMRKAQFGYGWDWGPRLPTIGIGQPVELKREQRAALDGVHIATLRIEDEGRSAVVVVRVEAEAFATALPLIAQVQLLAPDEATVASGTVTLAGDGSRRAGILHLTVAQPRLWWTHDLGAPARYTARVTLDEAGTTLDRAELLVGIRTLELDQSPDQEERGTRFFRFVLNGIPLFAKGANWIPADSFVGAIPAGQYTMLLQAARDGRMNMLRVWGGGIYEHDVFYDECDRLGLLVWQDFMFACAPYPESNREFTDEVAAEARYQVRRLRNHPCLALWCGNNENQWLHDMRYWDRPDYAVPGTLFYERILPAAVAQEDGYTPYWPGSPYGGDDYNSEHDGDTHNWNVWHGNYPRRFGEQPRRVNTPESVSFTRYAEDMGRFISEFGMHAAPVLRTLRTVIPDEQLYHHSPSMDWHNKDNPKNKGDNLMLGVTGLPDSLEEYIDFSMIAQAEGLKFGVEHFRRRMPHCSGTLVWQLNDCWPVLSWSVLDYYGVGKAGYFYLRRAYAPVMASFKALPAGGIELWITNDTGTTVEDSVTVQLGAFAGATIWEEHHVVAVDPRSSKAVLQWGADRLRVGPDRYLWVRSGDARFEPNRYFFAAIKDLVRARPAVETRAFARGPHEVQVELHAQGYAHFVHLLAPDPATRFSDNYFDLPPEGRAIITVTNPAVALRTEDIITRWR